MGLNGDINGIQSWNIHEMVVYVTTRQQSATWLAGKSSTHGHLMRIYIYMNIYIYEYIYIYMDICVYIYAYVDIYIYICMQPGRATTFGSNFQWYPVVVVESPILGHPRSQTIIYYTYPRIFGGAP